MLHNRREHIQQVYPFSNILSNFAAGEVNSTVCLSLSLCGLCGSLACCLFRRPTPAARRILIHSIDVVVVVIIIIVIWCLVYWRRRGRPRQPERRRRYLWRAARLELIASHSSHALIASGAARAAGGQSDGQTDSHQGNKLSPLCNSGRLTRLRLLDK